MEYVPGPGLHEYASAGRLLLQVNAMVSVDAAPVTFLQALGTVVDGTGVRSKSSKRGTEEVSRIPSS